MFTKKSIIIVIVVMIALAVPLTGVFARQAYPEIIPIPNGFQPEGIAAGKGNSFYTGSLNGGAIFRGNLRSGQIVQIAPQRVDRSAAGMAYDARSNLLFVAGAFTGKAFVYNGTTGNDKATLEFNGGFVNDVIVTRDAAYFTDSFLPVFYRVPLGPRGGLPASPTFETVPLGGEFNIIPGEFNANGIEATPDGKALIIINTVLGALYKVNPDTGEATLINLGGDNVNTGDGLVLRGSKLYVVQNFLNQIAVVELSPDLGSGEVMGWLTTPNFRIPTTAAAFGDALYAVNARFDTVTPGAPAPDDTFEAVRVPIH